ncbi:MAG: response regulator [Candidatus Omnitrophica bacterium]|nr:response regulator [Candidatus Omnitrophota bacterium]
MKKVKVLLVDDEPDFLKVMSFHITDWGYDLVTATNGKECVDIVKAQKPDIVILDYVMPDMDGLKALAQIRKIDKELPVIMFTANPDIKSIKGTKKLGVSAYIPKLCVYTDVPSSVKDELEKIVRTL